MLKYELIRVQLESNLIDLDSTSAPPDTTKPCNFASPVSEPSVKLESKECPSHTTTTSYVEGKRFEWPTYWSRKETEEARRIEEQVVAISVNKALYRMDEELVTFATAA